jgi:hypothetical protein
MAKEPEYMKWPMIPGAREERQIACNPKARISYRQGRGCSVISLKKFFPAPASPCGKPAGGLKEAVSRRGLRRNLPFLPGPCQAFIKHLINEIGEDPQIITEDLLPIHGG